VEGFVLSLPEPEDLELPADDGLSSLSQEALQRCLSFASAHPAHHVAAEVSRRRAAKLHAEGKYAEAAAAQASFVAAVKRILPEGIRGLAWFVELYARLAYLHELAGQRGEASEALRQVFDTMKFCSGQPPVPGMILDLLECPRWWKFLQEVGPELL